MYPTGAGTRPSVCLRTGEHRFLFLETAQNCICWFPFFFQAQHRYQLKNKQPYPDVKAGTDPQNNIENKASRPRRYMHQLQGFRLNTRNKSGLCTGGLWVAEEYSRPAALRVITNATGEAVKGFAPIRAGRGLGRRFPFFGLRGMCFLWGWLQKGVASLFFWGSVCCFVFSLVGGLVLGNQQFNNYLFCFLRCCFCFSLGWFKGEPTAFWLD